MVISFELVYKTRYRFTKIFQMHYKCLLVLFNEMLWFDKVDSSNIILCGKCPLLHRNNHPGTGKLKYQSYMEISRIFRPKINTKVY